MFYKFYIGSNNKTKELEEDKILNITADYFKGFTVYEAKGYWEGKPEETLILEVQTEDKNKVIELAKKLCIELKQDAIGLFYADKLHFISN